MEKKMERAKRGRASVLATAEEPKGHPIGKNVIAYPAYFGKGKGDKRTRKNETKNPTVLNNTGEYDHGPARFSSNHKVKPV